MRKIITFTGSKQAGKTTAFETMNTHFSEVREITIAGKLKRVVGEVLGIDEKHFHINALKEVPFEDPISITGEQIEQVIIAFGLIYDFDMHVRPHINTLLETPRETLQFFGTNVLHPIDDLVHLKQAVADMPESGIIVVTDLRFLQEFNYFQEKHAKEFFPFYIKNDNAESIAMVDTHLSEIDLQKFKHKCILIENNFSLEQYKELLLKNLKGII